MCEVVELIRARESGCKEQRGPDAQVHGGFGPMYIMANVEYNT
jgi:hypothetical protein